MTHRFLSVVSSFASVFLLTSSAFAEGSDNAVQLSSVDGAFKLNGEITAVDDRFGMIVGTIGAFEFEFSQMTCEGAACGHFDGWSGDPEPHAVLASRASTTSFLNELTTLASGSDLADAIVLSARADQPEGAHSVFDVGTADVAGRPGVASKAVTIRPDPAMQILGINAWSVITSGDTGVDAVSVQDLAAIFSGQITNWSALGGNDLQIVALKREPSSDQSFDLNAFVVSNAGFDLADTVMSTGSYDDLRHYVNILAGSIAIVETAQAGELAQISMTDQCGRPLVADTFAVNSGAYPLLQPLYVTHADGAVPESVVALFDTASTSGANELLADAGYFVDAVALEDAERKAERLQVLANGTYTGIQNETAQDMLSLMFTSTRLSTTFLGGHLTDQDQAWNRRAMLRLVEEIESGAYDGSEIVLVGFSTTGGRFEVGLENSGEAANTVLDALNDVLGADGAEARPVVTSAQSFGSFPEVACVHGSASSLVEVWVRQQ